MKMFGIGPNMPWTPVFEVFRSKLPEGAHGDTHMSVHGFKRPRTHKTLCGLPTADLLKCGGQFPGWEEVLCPTCDERSEI